MDIARANSNIVFPFSRQRGDEFLIRPILYGLGGVVVPTGKAPNTSTAEALRLTLVAVK
jgi:hypothetical protein